MFGQRSKFLTSFAVAMCLVVGGFAQEPLPITPPADAYGMELVEDSINLTHDDTAAYYGLLDHASLVSPVALIAAGKDFVNARRTETQYPTFVDMIKNPQKFRGKPVYLKGHILQAQAYDAQPNDYGIEQLYEVSLFIEDSQAHPITVVFLEKPEQLKIGGDMVDGIEVAGYFLKTYRYPSTDKHTRIAPLILANTINIKTPPPVAPLVPPAVSYGGLLVAFALIIAIVWYVSRSDRQRMLKRQHQPPETAPDFKAIEESENDLK